MGELVKTGTKEPQKFSIGFGSRNREVWIRSFLEKDPSLALILAAVHFEWVMKRAILVMGSSPTKALREELSGVYKIDSSKRSENTYKAIWQREVASGRKRASLGLIITKLPRIQSSAIVARGEIIHGNGVLSVSKARESVELFLTATEQLRKFVQDNGEEIDSRLSARIRRG